MSRQVASVRWVVTGRNSHGKQAGVMAFSEMAGAELAVKVLKNFHPSWRVSVVRQQLMTDASTGIAGWAVA